MAVAGGEVLADGTGIKVEGWEFTSRHGPIAADASVESLKQDLEHGMDVPLSIPEQLYDWNRLMITHHDSGIAISFNAEDALRAWRSDMPTPVRVFMASQWKQSKKAEMEAHNAISIDYDWTFTTPYSGTATQADSALSSDVWAETSEQFDRTLLTNRDPILFYDEILLYESELEDNGISQLSVKIRVMPKCWFVLLRFFLRVDRVMVRLREVRYFCRFADFCTSSGDKAMPKILRETKHQEGTFNELRRGGAPIEGPAYGDADSASVALSAVSPIGLVKYEMCRLMVI